MSFGYLELLNSQVSRFSELGYTDLPGISRLEDLLRQSSLPEPEGDFPLLLVIKSSLASPDTVLPKIVIKGKSGVVNMDPVSPADFSPLPELEIPSSPLYLLFGVSVGHDTLNITPADALISIRSSGRFPLTLDEGVSLLAQFPETLSDKSRFNAFQMSGSRGSGQRIPSIWLSYQRPRLGWCWDRNPHPWMGSASCSSRLG